MQLKTAGIVLHALKYSDSATIITIYTQQFGRVSYMVYGIHKKKSTFRSAFLQPLSLLDLEVTHVPGKDLQQIKEVRIAHPLTGIPLHPVKNALALFLAELLSLTLRQTEPDENLFLFLENSIQQLDVSEDGLANFHLVFMLKMTRYMGFEPNSDDLSGDYFDLLNGVFRANKPLHTHYLQREATQRFRELLLSDFSNINQLVYSRIARAKLLESLIEYYRLHLPEFHGLRSLEVMQDLFD